MKKILKQIIAFCVGVLLTSCAKDIVDLTGNIQGTVKDYTNGQLVSNCSVSLSPGGKSTSTDTNGSFVFENLVADTYTLSFSKSEYNDETQEVSVVTGETTRVNVSLKLLSATTGSISGVIKDFASGQLISNCNVSLTPGGSSKTSSSSGTYEFMELAPGEYTLVFSKAGYDDANTSVAVSAGKNSVVDIMLKAKSSFSLSESNYDFGDMEVTKVFYFFNNSGEDCSFTISNVPDWISFSQLNGVVKADGSEAIAATVDRGKVSEGDYNQNVMISYSGKSSGSVTLAVKMKKVELSSPEVSISGMAENITQTSFGISGNIVSTGGSLVTNYGHCWNTTGNPTIEDTKTDLGTSDAICPFMSSVDNLNTSTTYYVRAYAKNAQGVAYSEQIAVTTEDVASDKWDGNIASSFSGGSGTYADPYIIKTGGELLLVKDYRSSYFELGGNIDLNNHNWLPFAFEGTLDGKGYIISNLNISGRTENGQGLFSSLSGKVRDLTLRMVSINSSNDCIGAIAGTLSGTISNCSVYVKKIVGGSYVGGLVGKSTDGCSIVSCNVFLSESTSNISGNYYVGGICGYVESEWEAIQISGCKVNVNLKGAESVGGIVGMFHTRESECEVTKCGFSGSISGEQYLGGVVGESSGGEALIISQSYGDIQITAEKGYAGGIRGSSGDVYANVTIISCYAKGHINCFGTLSIGGIMGQRGQSGGINNYSIYHSYSVVTSSQDVDFDGFTTCGSSYESATISNYDNGRTTDCKVACTDITTFMKECYSEYSSHWDYDKNWSWSSSVAGETITVRCPKLAWE